MSWRLVPLTAEALTPVMSCAAKAVLSAVAMALMVGGVALTGPKVMGLATPLSVRLKASPVLVVGMVKFSVGATLKESVMSCSVPWAS